MSRVCIPFFLLGVVAPTSAGAAAPKLDPRVAPGKTFQVEFPRLPKTITGEVARMVVYIPSDYDPGKKHPLFLWLEGGRGRPRVRPDITGYKLFVCISLPLFRLRPRKSLLIIQEDAQIMWTSFKEMLAELEKIVPNLHPVMRVAGGFSNGAHTIGILLNANHGEFHASFYAYFLVDGGTMLRRLKSIKERPLLVLYGEKSVAATWLRRLPDHAKKAGVDAESIEMKGTGHAFPSTYAPRIGAWIKRQVVDASLPARLEAAKVRTVATDPASKLIAKGEFAAARADLSKRILETKDRADLYLLRAVARVPALREPVAGMTDREFLRDKELGWSAATERDALRDLTNALKAKSGKGEEPQAFNARCHFYKAKIYARRVLLKASRKRVGWISQHQNFVREVKAALKAPEISAETAALVMIVNAKVAAVMEK